MWKLKTGIELEKEKKVSTRAAKVYSFKHARIGLLIGLIYGLFKIYELPFIGEPDNFQFEDIMFFIGLVLLSGIGTMVIHYLYHKFFYKHEDSSSQRCSSCDSLTYDEEKKVCDCGGKYYPMNHFKWIEGE